MMSVGNERMLSVQEVREGKRRRGVADGPKPVPDLIEFDVNIRSALRFHVETLIQTLLRIGIEREDLAEDRIGGFEQPQPVFFGPRVGLLVRKNRALSELLEPAGSDKSPALGRRPPSGRKCL